MMFVSEYCVTQGDAAIIPMSDKNGSARVGAYNGRGNRSKGMAVFAWRIYEMEEREE